MHYETYAQYGLRLAKSAIAEHICELSTFTDATAFRLTYGTPLGLSDSLFHARMRRYLRTQSAHLIRAHAEWTALARKDSDDPDGDWDDHPHAVGDGPRKWQLGPHKSEKQWANRMQARGWTKEQITQTIAEGQEFPALNKVNPGNPAIRYELGGRFVVRDEVTRDILQISGTGPFIPSTKT